MTEDSQDTSTVPGSTAGDSAPTQAIPRISKESTSKPEPAARPEGGSTSQPTASKPASSQPTSSPTPAAKTAPAKKAPAKKAVVSSAGSSSQTDKGRPRQSPTAAAAPNKPAATSAVKRPTSGGTSTPAAKKPPVQPVGGPTGRPLTAADYARTTKQSPATTAVIPAVKDKDTRGDESKKSAAGKTTFSPSTGSGRRASLRLTHVEPWSVTRLAFTISVAMMIVFVVAAAIFWVVLDVAGVWGQINDSLTTVLSDDSSSFNVKDYFGFTRVVGLTLVLSALNVVLMTVLATIGAHLYNLAAQLMGGVEVTFAEEK